MSIAVDEFGNQFIVLREQDRKRRLKGLEAHRANIQAAQSIADTLRTSLGPKGMDKIIVSPDGDVTVTNDGATILSKMEVDHQCAKLLVELSNAQDDEIGDGTTGVVVLAGALLEQALRLLDKGLHPLKIAEGFDAACDVAVAKVQSIAVPPANEVEMRSRLHNAAMTALGSKVVSSCQKKIADLAVEAVLAVADKERKDVNFDAVRVEGRAGGQLEDSQIVHGVVLFKELSHSQMKKEIKDAKIAILTCPFEPPKPKTKHKLDIKTVDDYKALQAAEKRWFEEMIKKVQDSGSNFVICQWGFDDEANHLLELNDLPAVRWVGGTEMELIAIATAGKIVGRFEDLTPDKLGHAEYVREVTVGTENDQMILLEGCKSSKAITVLLRGGNQMIVSEAKRCFHDAICCVRNLLRCEKIVPGGGASEIAASLAVAEAADKEPSVISAAIRAFSEGLLKIPECLADNCGFDAVGTMTEARAKQVLEGKSVYGIDCNSGVGDLLAAGVWESLLSKVSQLQLATQVVRMILKIDDVIVPSEIGE